MCELISQKECARRLNISYRQLTKWMREGESPPYYRIGRRFKFRSSEVKQWIEERKINQQQKEENNE